MKLFLPLVFLLMQTIFVYAQDVILTVTGETNAGKVSLDSILVENLTNKTWLSLTNLPQYENYQINLTQKSLWGTVGIETHEQGGEFRVIQNQPGILMVASSLSTPVEAGMSLYNTNGQLIMQQSKRLIYPGQVIRVRTGGSGLYLLKIDAQMGIRTFKALGAAGSQSPNIDIQDGVNTGTVLKNAVYTSGIEFAFAKGDNIRVSVYKGNHSSNAVTRTISASESMTFELSELKDSSVVLQKGHIDLTEIPNHILDGLLVESIDGSTPVLLNGTFNLVNQNNDSTLYPILFRTGDDVLFGIYPQGKDEVVDIDNILVFFYKIFPQISLMELPDSDIVELMKENPDYANLRNAAIAALQKGISPIDDGIFMDLLGSSVAAIFENPGTIAKSTANFNRVGLLEFDNDRQGKIEWPKTIPFFAFLGIEISDKSTGKIVMSPKYIKPDKISMSPGSWYKYLYDSYIVNYLNEKPIPDDLYANSFQLPAEGSYIISFSNGNKDNPQGTIDRFFNEEVMLRNAEHLVIQSLIAVLHKDVKSIVKKIECLSKLMPFLGSKIKELKQLFETTQITDSKLNDFILLTIQGGAGILSECFPDIEPNNAESGYFNSFLKIFKKAAILEEIVNIGFGYKDWAFSQVAGTDIVHFYDGFSFSELTYTFESDPEIRDSYKSQIFFEGKQIKESKNTYSIIRDLYPLRTRFEKEIKESSPSGIPMKATLVEGDAKVLNKGKISTISGSYFVDLEMGAETSLLLIEPDFRNSGVDLLALTLIPLPAKSLNITGGNYQSGVVDKELSTALSVQVKDEKGNPVRNAEVAFEPGCSQCGAVTGLNLGTSTQVVVKTNDQGVASVVWKLGSKNGEQNVVARLTGNVDIPEVKFIAQAQGEPAAIVLVSSQLQYGNAGGYLAEDLKVRVIDKNGHGVKDIMTVFQVDCDDCGEVDQSIVLTDSQGYASTRWKIGNTSEDQFVAVSLGSYQHIDPVFFKALKDDNMFTDVRDGKTYKTVKIGNQTWLAENLAYLPVVSSREEHNATSPTYHVTGYFGTDLAVAKNLENYKTYGVLYNHISAVTACPAGWHLPSDNEWMQLEMSLGMSAVDANSEGARGTNQGYQLKSTSGWSLDGNGSDSSGFGALPGGVRVGASGGGGTFMNVGTVAMFYTSTSWTNEYNQVNVMVRSILHNYSQVFRGPNGKQSGMSVRCVRNN